MQMHANDMQRGSRPRLWGGECVDQVQKALNENLHVLGEPLFEGLAHACDSAHHSLHLLTFCVKWKRVSPCLISIFKVTVRLKGLDSSTL